jgi:hypothetical protein
VFQSQFSGDSPKSPSMVFISLSTWLPRSQADHKRVKMFLCDKKFTVTFEERTTGFYNVIVISRARIFKHKKVKIMRLKKF